MIAGPKARDLDDGLFHRFQIAFFPDLLPTFDLIDHPEDVDFHGIETLMDDINNIPDGDPHRIFRFTPEAQEAANLWRIGLEKSLRSPEISDSLKNHLGKYRSLMPSLALIFHLCEEPLSAKPVGKEALDLAIAWTDVLKAHAQKIFCSLTDSLSSRTSELVKKIKLGLINDGMKLRDIVRKNWKGLSSTKAVEESLSYLEEHGWVRLERELVRGGTRLTVRINPALKKGQ